jgi:hypothetical protein
LSRENRYSLVRGISFINSPVSPLYMGNSSLLGGVTVGSTVALWIRANISGGRHSLINGRAQCIAIPQSVAFGLCRVASDSKFINVKYLEQ